MPRDTHDWDEPGTCAHDALDEKRDAEMLCDPHFELMPDASEMDCDACGGPLTVLGTLAAKDWFRCRNCGLDQWRELVEVEFR